MNIKSRLRNIERKAGITHSEFCLCYGERLKWEVIPIGIDEWKRRTEAGEETMVKLPDKCEMCRKPIDKRFIVITFEQAQATVEARLNQAAETMAKFAD